MFCAPINLQWNYVVSWKVIIVQYTLTFILSFFRILPCCRLENTLLFQFVNPEVSYCSELCLVQLISLINQSTNQPTTNFLTQHYRIPRMRRRDQIGSEYCKLSYSASDLFTLTHFQRQRFVTLSLRK